MTLLENWRNLAYGDGMNDKQKEELWSGYFAIEKGIYEKILSNPAEVIEGTVKVLCFLLYCIHGEIIRIQRCICPQCTQTAGQIRGIPGFQRTWEFIHLLLLYRV